MKVSAIIPAAGQGLRLGSSVPKQFLHLDGKPILGHTLDVFQNSGLIDSIILVVPESEIDETRAQWLNNPPLVKKIIVGGKQRQDSVINGFNELDSDTDIVLVHDGVRPFISSAMIGEAITAAKEYGAAITAIPVNDTIKQVDELDMVEQTLNREQLRRVQTPQAFKYDLLKKAFAKADADSYYGTDEASLIEYIQEPVKIIGGSELNIKITRKEDLVLAEQILAHLKAQ
jgi:2-C-methyl-D-erythritol 4-phosphate cytidylyltransferase